jgi:hypothetical protein
MRATAAVAEAATAMFQLAGDERPAWPAGFELPAGAAAAGFTG